MLKFGIALPAVNSAEMLLKIYLRKKQKRKEKQINQADFESSRKDLL